MYIITLTYTKPIEIVDHYLAEHRQFLETGYQNDFFVASGPMIPRIGGIIISQLKDREQLETILKQDPFQIHQVAMYDIVEFTPVKYHKNFASFVEA